MLLCLSLERQPWSSCQDVFDYIADHGLAGALEGAHVAPLLRIDEDRAAALLVDRVAQVPPRVVVPALQVNNDSRASWLDFQCRCTLLSGGSE